MTPKFSDQVNEMIAMLIRPTVEDIIEEVVEYSELVAAKIRPLVPLKYVDIVEHIAREELAAAIQERLSLMMGHRRPDTGWRGRKKRV